MIHRRGVPSGTFNVERFIRKYGANSRWRHQSIPWKHSMCRPQGAHERLSLLPNRIRLRLVLDGSIRWFDDAAVKQLAVPSRALDV